jgi:hypothetical protein
MRQRNAQMSVVVGCHQPNFLPWLGFFAKVARSDVFFLLDDVQFTQGANKHNWTSRVRIGTANGPHWLSLPVRRSGVGRQLIADLRTDETSRWLPKMFGTLESSYKKAPYADDCLPQIIRGLSEHQGSVCETNVNLIRVICAMLDLKTKLICSSERPVGGAATERLVNLTLSESGTTYLSGDGAGDYQVIDQFEQAGINVRKLGFQHQPYPQRRGLEFVPGLSIIDALCYVGIESTLKLIEKPETQYE